MAFIAGIINIKGDVVALRHDVFVCFCVGYMQTSCVDRSAKSGER
jgi:hypothetical protein